MISFTSNFESQADYFRTKNIDIDFPGFYDHPNFAALEKKYPEILNNYASFVKQRTYSHEYLNHAKKVIEITCQLLHKQLETDGRKGACVDASIVLSRILEREGIWNYVVSGGLTLEFDPECMILKKYFWPIDNGDFSAAHVWLVAPPFQIIDLTVKEQPYKQDEKSFLPNFLLQENTSIKSIELEDIIEPNILLSFKREFGNNRSKILRYLSPSFENFTNYFPPETFSKGKVYFKYTPTTISASDVCLEDITSLKLNGMYGFEIYEKLIKPQLKR